MWLLNTSTLELKWFSCPEDVPGGYAILSHVWDSIEMTYQDLRAIHAQSRTRTDAPVYDNSSRRPYHEVVLKSGSAVHGQVSPAHFSDNLERIATHDAALPTQSTSSLDASPSTLLMLVGDPSKLSATSREDAEMHAESDHQRPPKRLKTDGQESLAYLPERGAKQHEPMTMSANSPKPSKSRKQHVQDSPRRQSLPTGNSRDCVSPKIRDFCLLAEAHGHSWVWADMCCIDKSSSAELCEAINSMFRYYALSNICYVYLRDVSSGSSWEDEFRKST